MKAITIRKSTKKIIEELSCDKIGDSHLNVLLENAIGWGHDPSDIEIKIVTDVEYEAAKALDPVEQAFKSEREEQQAIDSLINKKIKEQAIDALKKEGKLDANGKIKK